MAQQILHSCFNLGQGLLRFRLLDVMNGPVCHAIGPIGKEAEDHRVMFVPFESDNEVCPDKILLRESGPISPCLRLGNAAGAQSVGSEGRKGALGQMDGKSAGKSPAWQVIFLGVMIEDRFGEPATIKVPRADKEHLPIHFWKVT